MPPPPLPQPHRPPPLSQKRATPLPPAFPFTKRTPTPPVLHKTGPYPPIVPVPKGVLRVERPTDGGGDPTPPAKKWGGGLACERGGGTLPSSGSERGPHPLPEIFVSRPPPPCCTKKGRGGGSGCGGGGYSLPFTGTCQNLSVCHKLIDTDISCRGKVFCTNYYVSRHETPRRPAVHRR